jgi:threonine/homoserine/homoserine lactone efflux protein
MSCGEAHELLGPSSETTTTGKLKRSRMELLGTLLRGLVIGFSIAAPVGPIGVLCIRRTLADGRYAGFLSGLGAASADALYGCVAAFGLTSISGFLVDQQLLLRLVGGAFLLYLGFRIFREQPDEREAAIISGTSYGGLARAYSSTFLLTITNPLTILSFAAIFAGLGLVESAGYVLATVLVLGVFSGSALWWLLLSGGVSLFSSRLGLGTLRWVNRASGTIIFSFGVAALLSLLRGL